MVPAIELSHGVSLPQVGFGVYKIPDHEVGAAVATAFDAGYRCVDTATLYANERGVGEAVRSSGIARADVFVTTKLWNTDHGYDEALRAFDRSLGELALDYVDLYLIHWPVPSVDRYVETWRALGKILADGRARAIGVSNFGEEHLTRLLNETGVVPAVNQVELHPWLQRSSLVDFHRRNGIVTQAWSPLARGKLFDNETILAIAAKHGRTAAQVVLRWHVENGYAVIPKSVTPHRIAENIALFDFALDADDLAAIAALDAGRHVGSQSRTD
jgi:diketogulonate reductase-like aldo/keto reductase